MTATAQQSYVALTKSECEGRRPTLDEICGMWQERNRLRKKRRNRREELLLDRYLKTLAKVI